MEIGQENTFSVAVTKRPFSVLIVYIACFSLKLRNLRCRDGVVVRALASHQCDLGSIPRLGVICGFSLLVLYSALRGFSLGTPVFTSPQKPTFALIC